MKAKLGAGSSMYFDYLGVHDVSKRLKECRDLTRELSKAACAIDAAEAELKDKKPRPKTIERLLLEASAAAAVIKTKFWKPDDPSAYNLESASKQIAARVKKSSITEGGETILNPKAIPTLKRSMLTLLGKSMILSDLRSPYWCGLRNFEGVGPKPKDRAR